ncbi:MAG: anaerobic ribonucleoside-triphosphate reductase activating protein [Candidatus Aegiribacteria sp.]|nr:anaerobic ribonucleoside-triphosphate reductase activating protein [Candidatus Aegiribacteria sp.]
MIRSLTGTSLIEYPGKISSIIFISGCNLQCPFCHNPELVRPDMLDEEFRLTQEEIISELLKRKGFIEAVTITGGEPLLYSGIVDLIQNIKSETCLSVKVDTNGTQPRMLKEVLHDTDYIAMDLKSSPSKYLKATGEKAVFSDIRESIGIVMSLPAYEFRTTMVPGIVDRDDIIELLRVRTSEFSFA